MGRGKERLTVVDVDLEVELGEEELAEVEQAYVHVAAKMPQDVRRSVGVSHLSV